MKAIGDLVWTDGDATVIRNINDEVKAMIGRGRAGVRRAANLIRRESMKRTPIDTDTLRPSHYVEVVDGPSGPGAEIGCTASYAVFVHERTELHHKVGEAKFLENALKANADNVVKIIGDDIARRGAGPSEVGE